MNENRVRLVGFKIEGDTGERKGTVYYMCFPGDTSWYTAIDYVMSRGGTAEIAGVQELARDIRQVPFASGYRFKKNLRGNEVGYPEQVANSNPVVHFPLTNETWRTLKNPRPSCKHCGRKLIRTSPTYPWYHDESGKVECYLAEPAGS